MKRTTVVTIAMGLLALVVGIVGPVQAATITITFDEIEAWNTDPPVLTEEYASLGIHFTAHPYAGTEDGAVYDPGVFHGVNNGTQILGCNGPASGFAMLFDMPVTSISFEYYVVDPGSGLVDMGDGVLRLMASLYGQRVAPMPPGDSFGGFNSYEMFEGGWYTYSSGPQEPFNRFFYGFFANDVIYVVDNLTITTVPLPASVLLLGTGLLPLLSVRRKR